MLDDLLGETPIHGITVFDPLSCEQPVQAQICSAKVMCKFRIWQAGSQSSASSHALRLRRYRTQQVTSPESEVPDHPILHELGIHSLAKPSLSDGIHSVKNWLITQR